MKALLVSLAVALAACAVDEAPAQAQAQAQNPTSSWPNGVRVWPTNPTLECAGAFTQGGIALCRTVPHSPIYMDGGQVAESDENGWAVIGFSREHGPSAHVTATVTGPHAANEIPVATDLSRTFEIAPRTFDIQRVNGLPQQTVTPTDPAVIARIQHDAAIKNAAFQSIAPLEGWLDGFVRPIDAGVGVVTGTWGNQRVLNGTPSSPHFGYDIAAPIGTPVHAPASGVVTLAENDTFYEGGLVFIDHGQGLITMYLHMSAVNVHVGDHVTQGQVIGAVGDRGRATGPHLCWRMKWRDRQLDPSVAIDGLAQARAQLIAAHN